MSRIAILTLAAVATVGLLVSNLMPVLLSDYRRELGLSDFEAGLVATLSLLAAALAAFKVASRTATSSLRRLARIAVGVSATGYILSAVLPGVVGLVAGQLVVGVGCGLAGAVGNAAVAGARDPDRTAALVVTWSTLLIATLLVAIPVLADSGGRSTSFLTLAVVSLLVLPCTQFVPERGADLTPAPADAQGRPGAALVTAAGLYGAGEAAIWAFSQDIGVEQAGATEDFVGVVLSVATLLSLLVGVLVVRIGGRYGRIRPLIATIVIASIGKLLIASAESEAVFALGQVVAGLTIVATLAYFISAAAVLDSGGRWAATVAGAFSLGAAAGPVLAGAISDATAYPGIGVLTTILAVGVVGLLWSLRTVADSRTEAASERRTPVVQSPGMPAGAK